MELTAMARGEIERNFERFRARGDWTALASVFDAVAPKLLSLARHLAWDEAGAEDLVQATLLAAIEHKERFDPERDLAAWLGGILTNKAKLARALRAREIDRERVALREEIDPALDAELREFVAVLEAALLRIPAKYRAVLRGHLADGKKPDELARDLGRAPGTVRVQLHRGLARLRRLLPMSFALGIAPSTAPRGLTDVRREVVRAARLAAPNAAVVVVSAIGSLAVGAKLLIVGGAAAACAGLGWWIAAKDVAPARIAAMPTGAPRDHALAAADAQPSDAGALAARHSVAEEAPEASTGDSQRASASPAPATASITARFVGPTDGDIELGSGKLLLRADDGPVREFPFVSAHQVTLDGLELGTYSVDLVAAGADHRRQTLDVRAAAKNLSRSSEREELRVVVWLPNWIAIVARTSDGHSFGTVADELGIERKNLFVDAFRVKTWRDPSAVPAGFDPAAMPAIFWPPPRYQQWELPGDVIGSLQSGLPVEAMWVELSVFGAPLGAQFLPEGAREVVFTLDAAAFESRFARLALAVVGQSGAPLRDAKVTLRADTSAHRRSDQDAVAPGPDGSVVFERVLPGRYELVVERGDAIHQDRIELAIAERRDLGTVVLGSGRRIELRVVDAQGQPVDAWIEIGPYRRGESIEKLYPPCLTRMTERRGEGSIPMPTEPSILRVTHREHSRGYPTDDRCSNVLIDPTRPPQGALTLVVHDPREVVFDVQVGGAARIEVLDELELVMDSRAVEGQPAVKTELLPGRYLARALDAEGAAIASASFAVAGGEVHIALR